MSDTTVRSFSMNSLYTIHTNSGTALKSLKENIKKKELYIALTFFFFIEKVMELGTRSP